MTDPERDAKRLQILMGVWGVIVDRGIEAVSVRSVAAEAGVSAGRVQHYFPTKADLVRESARLMIAQAEAVHDEHTGQREHATSPSARDELWHLLTHAFAGAEESRAGVGVFYAFLAASTRDPQIADILRDAKGGGQEEAARLLRLLAPDLADHDAVARQLVALADGFTLSLLLHGTTRRRAEADLRRAMDRLIQGQG